jgi:hypothetical protein
LREIKTPLETSRHDANVSKKFPLNPAHPERTCWGCDKFCAADSMICGNGSERSQHPIELFGPEWLRMGLDPVADDPNIKLSGKATA